MVQYNLLVSKFSFYWCSTLDKSYICLTTHCHWYTTYNCTCMVGWKSTNKAHVSICFQKLFINTRCLIHNAHLGKILSFCLNLSLFSFSIYHCILGLTFQSKNTFYFISQKCLYNVRKHFQNLRQKKWGTNALIP
jgi:hypothetical protein